MSAAAGGAAAACLGLGALAAVVLVLWIASPYPDSGLTGALHIGAGLWLLAQGAELVRTETLSGDPAPIALTPLLLSALPAWLLYRGTSSAVSAARGDDEDDEDDEDNGADPDDPDTGWGPRSAPRSRSRSAPRSGLGSVPGARSGAAPADEGTPTVGVREAALVAGWVLAGYLSITALAVVFTAHGFVHVDPLTTLYVPLFAVVAAGCGAWAGAGRPALAPLLPIPYAEEAVAALRAAGVALGVLACGGALLGGVSLAWHAWASGGTYGQLSGPIAGRFAVLLIAVALVPNLAVWACCYALGPGFSVGVGSVVGPAGASGYGMLPQFPLLAALPEPSHGSGPGWATLALAAVAACAVAWCAGNVDLPGWRSTLRIASAAALFYGVAVAVLAAWAGGALGQGRLAEFGPNCWLSGAAAAVWVLLLAVPGALTVRWYVVHPLHPWRALGSRWWTALRVAARFRRAEPSPAAEVPAQPPAPLPAPAPASGADNNGGGSYGRFDPDAPMLPLPPLTDPLPWPTTPSFPPLPPSAPPPPPEEGPVPPAET